MAMDKRARAASESLGFYAIAIGILVALVVVGEFGAFVRIDMTKNDLFSLSDGSRRLAGDLTDTLEITAYFTEDLPPPFNATERYVRDILTEYESASGGKIQVRFVNPDDEEIQKEAEAEGIRKISHQVIENDSVSVVEGYRGLVLRYLDKKETMAVIQDTAGLEYELTTRLKKMTGDRRPVGLLAGHEGPTLAEGLSGLREALPTYDIKEVQATEPIDPGLAALLVISPQTELSQDELRHINDFALAGGSVGFFGGTMKVDMEGAEPKAEASGSGVNTLLESWGVKINDDIVADAQCRTVGMPTNLGIRLPVPYPPLPIVSFSEEQGEHPAMFRLSQAVMPFSSSVAVTGSLDNDSDVEVTTLATSSEYAWKMAGGAVDLKPRQRNEWNARRDGPIPLVVAVEGKLPSAFSGGATSGGEEPAPSGPSRGTANARVLVVGSGFAMRDEFLPPANPQTGERDLTAALAFALNAVDWLAQDSDLVAIRAKNVEDPNIEVPADVQQAEDSARSAEQRAIESVQQGDQGGAQEAVAERDEALEKHKEAMAQWETTKALYRWGNMLGIPALLGLFGIVRWQMRRAKKAALGKGRARPINTDKTVRA